MPKLIACSDLTILRTAYPTKGSETGSCMSKT